MAKLPSNKTPLMQQHSKLKKQHPDAILLFRVGDFYEGFGQDAIDIAAILNITLTKRNNEVADSSALAGFPHHALETYLHKLVQAGRRVAICEQLENPKKAKGLVKRGITEIITPGAAISDKILNAKKNNYLATFYQGKNNYGIAFTDISTASFYVAEGNLAFIKKLMTSFVPSEVLVSKRQLDAFQKEFGDTYYTYTMEEWIFNHTYAKEEIASHFHIHHSLKGFGLDILPEAVVATGSILHYLKEIKHPNLKHLTRIQRIQEKDHLWMDYFTIESLELVHGMNPFVQSINGATTPMGERLLKNWVLMPLKNLERIEERLSVTNLFFQYEELRETMANCIKTCGDIERLLGKVPTRKINPREVMHIAISLEIIEKIKQLGLQQKNSYLHSLCTTLQSCHTLVEKIQSMLVDRPTLAIGKGELIKSSYHQELKELRYLLSSGKESILAIQAQEAKNTGIPNLKIGFNNVFGYYLEVTNTHRAKVPSQWIRKQTLTNCERYITPDLKAHEEKVLTAQERIHAIETEVYESLLHHIENELHTLTENARSLAIIDCLQGFAIQAKRNHYVKPNMTNSHELQLIESRHPVVEQTLAKVGEEYIPNNITLNKEQQQILLITGPNMSGKSATLRQTALNVLMAHVGCFVACSEATIPITDKIFTRVGANDNIAQGESTFMVEMNETSNILNHISEKSIILLDEIGRGTSTYDGISIAWSIIEHLSKSALKPKTVFSTHYHELVRIEEHLNNVKNYHISYRQTNDNIIFLRKLKRGGSLHSFGIHVAKMSGLPKPVIERAEQIMHSLEQSKKDRSMTFAVNTAPRNIKEIAQSEELWQAIKNNLNAIDINRLTPVEALLKLQEIRSKLS